MSLSAGTRLGPYEVLAPLGAGGMGEVYRARDTRLGRDVAVKVLPPAFADDPDRLRRFELEARAAGMLNHPNILTVHDVGTYNRAAYIVSELLEGETLRARLAGGALPIRKALDYALQMARGLAGAHRKGIVHRDLKPENLFLMRDGQVKILDFGLAKLILPDPVGPGSSEAATRFGETQPGAILGTVGLHVARAGPRRGSGPPLGIFAFGAILYEMLTGLRAFRGDTAVERMNAILKEDPPGLGETLRDFPPALEHLLRHSLEKDPENRFQSIRDLGLALEALSATSSPSLASPAGRAVAAAPATRQSLGWIVGAVFALGVALLAGITLLRAPADERRLTLSVLPPEGATLVEGQAPAISPDGRLLAFVATDRSGQDLLYVRPLDAPMAQPLSGSQGAKFPFWSPDSRFIGFFADGKRKRVEAVGGEPQTLCEASQNPRGGTWNRDGVILFTPSPPLPIHRVSFTGGQATPLSSDLTVREWFPSFLPDGRHFLYHAAASKPDLREVRVGSLDGPETKTLIESPFTAVYSPPGYLLFRREGTLMAQRFDAERLELTGDPFPVAAQVGFDGLTYRILASASDNGVLAYHDVGVGKTRLVWFHRDGRELGAVTAPGDYGDLSLSPDGRKAAFYGVDLETGNVDIRLVELAAAATSRFTFDPAVDFTPVWSPDGTRLTFSSNPEGWPNLFEKVSSGAGNEERVLKRSFPNFPFSWSGDGRLLVYGAIDPKTRWDLWVLPLDKDREPFALLQTEFDERSGQLSPDSRWLAFVSNESGRDEVYVLPFPAGPGKWQVSTGGGDQPRWRSDGRELFYVGADRRLVAVEVKASASSFEAGPPRRLLDVRITGKDGPGWQYDVAADGQRFLVNHLSEESARSATTVVVNWSAALPKK